MKVPNWNSWYGRYGIQITGGRFGFDLEEKSDTADIVKKYAEEFGKLT